MSYQTTNRAVSNNQYRTTTKVTKAEVNKLVTKESALFTRL